MTIWTSSTSEKPMRSALLMSKDPSLEAVSTALVQDLIELIVLGHLGEFDVDTSADTSSEVARASKDVSKMLVPHVLFAGSLHVLLDLSNTLAPTVEDLADVTTLLHGDDSEMVLFVDPHEEVLVVVVPDSSCVGPVAGHS